ncbi:MAG: hypothetical protein CL845_00185 [Crocinitomicaceae bacterium]|nr:hypothetical protein [Crocinitomicaceae bacterium]
MHVRIPFFGWMLMVLIAASCTKHEFNISEETEITGILDPAFAVPLVHGDWRFAEVIEAIEFDGTLETATTGEVTAVFPFDAFETAPILLVPLSESAQSTIDLEDEEAEVLSLLPAGAEFGVDFSISMEVPIPNLTEVDSVWLGGGVLAIQIDSYLPIEIIALGRCDNIVSAGEPLVVTLSTDAVGESTEVLIPLSQISLIGAGEEMLSLEWDWSFVLVSSGQPVEAGELLTIKASFDEATVAGVFGKFSSELSHNIEAQVAIPELTSWDPALFYLSAPRLLLEVKNSFGVDLGLEVSELSLLADGSHTPLHGNAVHEFPVFEGAPAVGDTTWISHVLDNTGMVPTLSDVMNLANDSLLLIGAVDVLPNPSGGQFAMATDVLSCSGSFEVPLAGWVKGLTWRDTLLTPISQALRDGVAPPLDWMDVSSLTLRFIVDNALPLELNGSVNFINIHGDSLLAGPDIAIPGGADTPAIVTVDYVLNRTLALELLEMQCTAVALSWTLATTGAGIGESIQVFADDLVSMRIAAKVECQIDPDP